MSNTKKLPKSGIDRGTKAQTVRMVAGMTDLQIDKQMFQLKDRMYGGDVRRKLTRPGRWLLVALNEELANRAR